MKAFKIILICLFAGTLAFVFFRSSLKGKKQAYKTTTAEYRDIKEDINLAGNVFPVKEIEIKSQLSGVLESIHVAIGDNVTTGSPIASIMLVPSASDIERLEYNLSVAQIEYKARLEDYEREKKLFESNVIAKVEMDNYTNAYMLAKEKFLSAQNQLNILKEGRTSAKAASNVVKSSINGVVIDIPLELGSSITERNNFNPGTTIAVVAEMSQFRFKALVAEKYLANIAPGDTISIQFSAYEKLEAKAVITKISAKGNAENGVMKYMLEAEFPVSKEMPVIRSGYSATANIIIKNKKNVLSIDEKYILYENDSTFVYVLDKGEKEKIKKNVILGASDSEFTEILKGVLPYEEIITDSIRK